MSPDRDATWPVVPALRVLRRERSGSSSPVVVATHELPIFTKLRGAAQGVTALIAEIIVAELAEAMALRVPARSLVEIAPDIPSDDQNDELRDLLSASVGLNVGFELLERARNLTAVEYERVPLEVASAVLWLDMLTQNLDRSSANPNIMVRDGSHWLIDHGAALPFQHDWSSVHEDSPHRPYNLARHVFGWTAPVLMDAHHAVGQRITHHAIATAVARVPDDYLRAVTDDVDRRRAMYTAFLWKRAQWMPNAIAALLERA